MSYQVSKGSRVTNAAYIPITSNSDSTEFNSKSTSNSTSSQRVSTTINSVTASNSSVTSSMNNLLSSPHSAFHGIHTAIAPSTLSSTGTSFSHSHMSTATSPQPALQWEELRKQARSLENEIDMKIVSYSKLAANYTTGSTARIYHSSSGDSGSSSRGENVLVSRLNCDQAFESTSRELEQLLARLTRINDQMASSLSLSATSGQSSITNGAQSSAALLHTVQRHRDILQDYSHEFQKIRSNIVALRDRYQLLGNSSSAMGAISSASSSASLYLKENEHLRSSDRLIEDQIRIAIATKENLVAQRARLGAAGSRLLHTLQQFPLVNKLTQRINLRRRRDTIILAVLIAFCTCLLLLFLFH